MEVDGYTNFKILGESMKATFWATTDSVVWSFLNTMILLLFAVASPAWYIAQKTGKFIYSRSSKIQPDIPNLYAKYKEKLDDGNLKTVIFNKLQNPTPNFDFDLAEFHLQLSSLVYQPWSTVQQVFGKWQLPDVEFVRFGHEGCCVLVVWSVTANFVVLAFKGTSPCDLNDWLTDCTLRKGVAKNGLLPGLLHSGFYGGFGFPEEYLIKLDQNDEAKKEFDNHPGFMKFRLTVDGGRGGHFYDPAVKGDPILKPTPTPEHTSSQVVDGPSVSVFLEEPVADPPLVGGVYFAEPGQKISVEQKDFWMKIMYPNLLAIKSRFRKKQPNLWITGHSLGAAAATVFTSTILWRRSELGSHSSVPNMDWDKVRILHS
ncbi:hypothetical protein BC938DRAFT_484141 [Jimgerdemannia flammicorona]|uniref:Fungal lipase-type domain-containing protein n=1 Tax=Jimgerdemannia flammicorona TaxID=994334 RepID=A0A433QAK9_9FUNG|nr:hypothetical protein BC938DRAFT_484141 [Jimgerdemannia flammicorona]